MTEQTPKPVEGGRYSAPPYRIITGRYCLRTKEFGVKRSRIALHDWVQKAAIETNDSPSTGQVALDETVVKIDSESSRLNSDIDPKRSEFTSRPFIPQTTVMIERFFPETALDQCGLKNRHDPVGDGRI